MSPTRRCRARGKRASEAEAGRGSGEVGERPAADETVVPAVVVVETEGEQLGVGLGAVLAGEHAQGALLDLGLDAAAAEGAVLAAVGEDEHGGAGFLGRGAARL